MIFLLFSFLILLIAALSFIHWNLYTSQVKYKGKPVPCISGSVPILFSVPTFVRGKDDVYGLLTAEHYKNGPIWTFSAPLGMAQNVMINDPALLQELMSNQRSKPTLVKDRLFMENSRELLGDGIFATNEHWAEQRKLMSRLFKVHSLVEFQNSVFVQHTEQLIEVLAALPDGAEVDVQDLFMRLTLDTGMHVFYGIESADSVKKGTTPYSAAFNDAQKCVDARYAVFFYKWLPWWMLPSERLMRKSISVLDDFFYATIRERRAAPDLAARTDLLSLMLRDADAKGRDDRYIRDVMANVLIAARDTVAQALTWLLFYLAGRPDAQVTAVREIEEVWGPAGGPPPDLETIRRKMPYLSAVINETLRMAPPVPWDGMETSEEVVLGGGDLVLPKGVNVNYAALILGMDQRNWKADVNQFLPERWLREDSIKQHGQVPFIPFNLGSRKCLGDVFAQIEMKVVLSLLLPHFHFKVKKGFQPKRITAITMMCENGMWMEKIINII